MTVGAYAFAMDDWKEMQYPLDLWIKHNSELFDKLSLVFIGDKLKIPELPDNVILTHLEKSDSRGWEIYTRYKQIAQDKLDTEWKLLLDTDEFLNRRIETKKLDTSKIYAIKYHHLYGNPNTEIIGAYPPYYWRFHYGRKKVINDGGSIEGDQMKYFKPHLSFGIRSTVYQLRRNGIRRLLYEPHFVGEVWHTNTLRDPQVMKMKWRIQIQRAIDEGRTPTLNRFDKNITGEGAFSYDDLAAAPYVKLVKVTPPAKILDYYGKDKKV